MEQFILSEMKNKNFSKAVNEICLINDYNHEQYPEYYKWYYMKNIPRVLQGTGEVIFNQPKKLTRNLSLIQNNRNVLEKFYGLRDTKITLLLKFNY